MCTRVVRINGFLVTRMCLCTCVVRISGFLCVSNACPCVSGSICSGGDPGPEHIQALHDLGGPWARTCRVLLHALRNHASFTFVIIKACLHLVQGCLHLVHKLKVPICEDRDVINPRLLPGSYSGFKLVRGLIDPAGRLPTTTPVGGVRGI